MPITFTLDLEDHRVGTGAALRCGPPTWRFLDWLAASGDRATVFVVGTLAEQQPDLVREIAAAGHEIGLHAWHHVPIHETGEARFLDELRQGKALLEDLAQTSVGGYRAPIFSLTRRTPWAVDALQQAGFTYSSSVLPADNPLFGIAGAPRTPFRWSNGLLELPCPLLGRGRVSLPFLGGVYLRYLPLPLIAAQARKVAREDGAWSYLHPYDLDPEEAFEVLPHAGYVTSRIVHHRRRSTLRRLERLRSVAGAGEPLGVVAERLATKTLPVMHLDPVADGAPSSIPGDVR